MKKVHDFILLCLHTVWILGTAVSKTIKRLPSIWSISSFDLHFICLDIYIYIYIYALSFNCYRKKHKTGPDIFILETRVWHFAWWPVRTGTGSPVSVYERFEPDICNITLNHDVGSVFSSIFTGNLVMIFWENMGNVGSWMWQSCSNVRWLPDILLYPRFAAKSLNNCF